MTPLICYLACHGASSDHFATFIQHTTSDQVQIRVYAADDMAKRFEDKNISVEYKFQRGSADDAEKIAKECSIASLVISDVGHQYAATLLQAIRNQNTKTRCIAYYDNPETFVPGGYSQTAQAVMQAAHEVLFANANLASETLYSAPGVSINLTEQIKIGLGYYPLAQAEAVAKQREARRSEERAKLLDTFGVTDRAQKIIVYFGGNNEEYFEKAFPAFCKLLSAIDHSSYIFILQQHPAGKKTNRDANQIANLPILVSSVGSDIAQIVADHALYYQTSMGPQFVLAGIPTSQIGHERYEDILVRGKLINSITTVEELTRTLNSTPTQHISREELLSSLGINPEWPKVLISHYIK